MLRLQRAYEVQQRLNTSAVETPSRYELLLMQLKRWNPSLNGTLEGVPQKCNVLPGMREDVTST